MHANELFRSPKIPKPMQQILLSGSSDGAGAHDHSSACRRCDQEQPCQAGIQRNRAGGDASGEVFACVAVFHLPQLLTATAWCASGLQLAAHSLKADMVISRPMIATTSKAMCVRSVINICGGLAHGQLGPGCGNVCLLQASGV